MTFKGFIMVHAPSMITCNIGHVQRYILNKHVNCCLCMLDLPAYVCRLHCVNDRTMQYFSPLNLHYCQHVVYDYKNTNFDIATCLPRLRIWLGLCAVWCDTELKLTGDLQTYECRMRIAAVHNCNMIIDHYCGESRGVKTFSRFISVIWEADLRIPASHAPVGE